MVPSALPCFLFVTKTSTLALLLSVGPQHTAMARGHSTPIYSDAYQPCHSSASKQGIIIEGASAFPERLRQAAWTLQIMFLFQDNWIGSEREGEIP